jgi:hypothetical protein
MNIACRLLVPTALPALTAYLPSNVAAQTIATPHA